MDKSELANNIFFLYDIALKAAFVFKLTFSGELKVHVVPDCYLLFSPFLTCHVMFCFYLSRVLISTDVWARGIDVQQVSLVINYDLPNNRELYIHRYVYCLWSPVLQVMLGGPWFVVLHYSLSSRVGASCGSSNNAWRRGHIAHLCVLLLRVAWSVANWQDKFTIYYMVQSTLILLLWNQGLTRWYYII